MMMMMLAPLLLVTMMMLPQLVVEVAVGEGHGAGGVQRGAHVSVAVAKWGRLLPS